MKSSNLYQELFIHSLCRVHSRLPMLMENNKNHRAVGHDHDQDFRDIECPVLRTDVVQHYIGKRPVRDPVRDALVHHREGSRRQYKIDDHKEKC